MVRARMVSIVAVGVASIGLAAPLSTAAGAAELGRIATSVRDSTSETHGQQMMGDLRSAVRPGAVPAEGTRSLVWGRGGDGALGTGGTSNAPAPVEMVGGANTLNTWGADWYSMDGGYDQTCGVGTDQRAYCWGDNGSGQLGDGTNDDSTVPVTVVAGANPTNTWLSVSAGSNYSSCGVGTDDSAYCWGYNSLYGQLGNNSTVSSSEPVAVVGGPASWTSVRVGAYHVCGLGFDDSAYCWGNNFDGQLGDGTEVGSRVPVRVVGGPTKWAEVSAGLYHTCGIGVDESAYCWGSNSRGALGDGTGDDSTVPVRVLAGANSSGTWKSVITGPYFSCGIGGDDSAYCWGSDSNGQLGDGGTMTDQSTPVRVALPAGVTVRMLTTDAYADHVCALSIDDTAYCWGSGSYGQLGDGNVASSSVPVPVQLSADLATGSSKMIAVGSYTSLMVSAFGTAPVFTAESPTTSGTVGTAYPGYTFAASGTAPITFTKASGTLPPGLTLASGGLLSGTPTTAGTYTFTVKASNGINPAPTTSSITIAVSAAPSPGPDSPLPPSAPVSVAASAGDGQAVVSWAAPVASGSFPVTNFQVQSSPGGRSCLAAVPALTCTVMGLTNGTNYTFTVRALNGAGWGAMSERSNAVTPQAPVAPSIRITGSRDATDPRIVRIVGTATGLEGLRVTPWVRFPGQREFRAGLREPVVAADGTFAWSRKTARKVYVYFTYGAVRSAVVVIRAR